MECFVKTTQPMSGAISSTFMAACSICTSFVKGASKTCHNVLRCHSSQTQSL